jgi:hypothetical protein
MRNICEFRHVEGRIARVLDAVESPNTDTVMYEGGKKTVSANLDCTDERANYLHRQYQPFNLNLER